MLSGEGREMKISVARARKALELGGSVKEAARILQCDVVEIRRVLSQPDRRGRKPRTISSEERDRLMKALRENKGTRAAARACGMSQTTFLRRINTLTQSR